MLQNARTAPIQDANYECMKKCSVAYAASFGDPHFTDET